MEPVNNHGNTCHKYVFTKCDQRSRHFFETNTFLSFNREASNARIDLGFAIAAGSSYGDETFQLLKDTIAEVVTEYGTDKIRCGLVVFGNTATAKIQLITVTNVDDPINVLNVFMSTKGGASLEEML